MTYLSQRSEQSDRQLANALYLLRRLAEWDVMQSTADGSYWKQEIARVVGDEAAATPWFNDRMAERDRYRAALEAILHQPFPHRNPDGEDDYVEAVRMIATEALS